MSGRRIAAFDFDGTISRRDTLLPFLARACGMAAFSKAISRVAPLTARARAGRHPEAIHHRDASKEALLAELMTGREQAWLRQQGADYARLLPTKLRPEMVEQVAWHRAAGHELVIVSAGLAAYLEPFAASQGFDHVIAVELEAGENGHLTGAMIGPNVRGAEKARRLAAWLGDDRPELMWAYGNSSGDRELLAMADVPVWVAGASRAKRDTTARPIGAGGRALSI